MPLFTIALVFVGCAYKFGDWKNWKIYYPTMIFCGFMDLFQDILTYNKQLWNYSLSPIVDFFINLISIFLIYPATILMFLPNIPKDFKNKIVYIIKWSMIYIIWEGILFYMNFIQYFNGWNILWSFGLDIFIFSLLYLHYKKPLWAWPVCIISTSFLVFWFKLPLK